MSAQTPTWQPAAATIAAYAASHRLTPIAARMELIKQHLASERASDPPRLPVADFVDRIPVSVWSKVQQASMAATAFGAALHQGLARLYASGDVIANNPDLLGMLAALVQAGVITDAERTQILSF
jgi:hypothetical protein